MLRDYLWQPLGYIDERHLAYLIHPGSTMTPVRLSRGWQWHWPLLSTIRLQQHSTMRFAFGQSSDSDRTTGSGQAIVCVSRDHQLFVAEGELVVTGSAPTNGFPGYMH